MPACWWSSPTPLACEVVLDRPVAELAREVHQRRLAVRWQLVEPTGVRELPVEQLPADRRFVGDC